MSDKYYIGKILTLVTTITSRSYSCIEEILRKDNGKGKEYSLSLIDSLIYQLEDLKNFILYSNERRE